MFDSGGNTPSGGESGGRFGAGSDPARRSSFSCGFRTFVPLRLATLVTGTGAPLRPTARIALYVIGVLVLSISAGGGDL